MEAELSSEERGETLRGERAESQTPGGQGPSRFNPIQQVLHLIAEHLLLSQLPALVGLFDIQQFYR